MTPDEPAVPHVTGEERLRVRQRSFFRYCGVAFAVALVAGAATGYLGSLIEDGRLPVWLVYITSLMLVAGFAWFLRDYLRRIDELDLMDNLWACLIGFFFYYVAFPIWNSLAAFNLAPTVNDWWLWIATTIVMFAAYGFRKLGFR